MYVAIILASIPVIAYVMNFAYEAGFAKRLGISPGFISLNFIDVLNNIIPITFAFTFTLGTFILFAATDIKTFPQLYLISNNLILMLPEFILVTFLLLYPVYFFPTIITLYAINPHFVILITILLIVYLLSQYSQRFMNLKYDLFKAKRNKIGLIVMVFVMLIFLVYSGGIVQLVKTWLVPINESSIVSLIVSLAFMFLLSYRQGVVNSQNQVDYCIIVPGPDDPNVKRIALRSYGDVLICSDIKRENGLFKRIDNYIYLKLADLKEDTKLVPDRVGPLVKR